MQFYLSALRAIPGDPCAPTEPCIPTEPCTPTDPCINERLLSALPLSLAERLGAPAPGLSMFTELPGDPCAPTDPCIVSQPTDPCIDTQPGDPCIFALPIASLGEGHEWVALNPQPLPPQESRFLARLSFAASQLGTTGEIEMVQLQSLSSQRQQALQVDTNAVTALGAVAQSIAPNVGR